MLGLRRNCHDDASDAEHVKLKPLLPSPPQWPSSLSLPSSRPILLLQRLQLNQHLNERITFSLEQYHKNVIKKLAASSLGKFQVFRLTKNVCQT
ncbi:hypothetical protein KR054_009714 [Drosophila jambulina]|nr:hypothetical protein KR054_009714 [Drosophila jambulina]